MKLSIANRYDGPNAVNLISLYGEVYPDFGPDDDDRLGNLFSVISISNYAECQGIRICKFRTDTNDLDFHDRALFGVGLHYRHLFIELFFVRIQFG